MFYRALSRKTDELKTFVHAKAFFMVISFVFIGSFIFHSVSATPDQELTYHGKLTDNLGLAVPNGSYDFTLTIYDAPTGGMVLWTDTETLTVTNGIFSTTLTGLDTLTFDQNYYLGVQINANSEMIPRRKITPTGFALNAHRLNGLTADNYIDTSAIAQTKQGNFTVGGNLTVDGALYDSNGQTGSNGQILSSTNVGTDWVDVPSFGSTTFLELSDTPSSYTSGSILFTSNSAVTQDNANLYWDDANNRLGVGTSIPIGRLNILPIGNLNGGVPGIVDYEQSAINIGNYNGTTGTSLLFDNDQIELTTSGSEQLHINYNSPANIIMVYGGGNVGIGAGTPTAKLHIVDDSSDGIFGPSDSGDGSRIGVRLSETQTLQASDNGKTYFSIGGSFNAVTNFPSGVTNNGYVTGMWGAGYHSGFGNISAVQGVVSSAFNRSAYAVGSSIGMLSNYGNYTGGTGTTTTAIGIQLVSYRNSGTVTNGYGVYINDVLATTDFGIYQVGSSDNNYFAGNMGLGTNAPTYRLQLSTDSAAKPGTNTWTIASDRNVKKDINTFTGGLDMIMNIDPVTYKYNGLAGFTDTDTEYVGIIAQDFKKNNPNLAPYTIGTFKTKLNPDDDEETELLNFNSGALTFVTINAIKEQQKLIQTNTNDLTTKATATSLNELQDMTDDQFTQTSILITSAQKEILTLQEKTAAMDTQINTITTDLELAQGGIDLLIALGDTDITKLTALLALDPNTLIYSNNGITEITQDLSVTNDVTIGNILTTKKLVADEVETQKLTIKDDVTLTDDNEEDVNAASVGTAAIDAQETEVVVETTALTKNSRVFVTPTSAMGDNTYYIEKNHEKNAFTILLNQVSDEKITFDWFIVNSENID